MSISDMTGRQILDAIERALEKSARQFEAVDNPLDDRSRSFATFGVAERQRDFDPNR